MHCVSNLNTHMALRLFLPRSASCQRSWPEFNGRLTCCFYLAWHCFCNALPSVIPCRACLEHEEHFVGYHQINLATAHMTIV